MSLNSAWDDFLKMLKLNGLEYLYCHSTIDYLSAVFQIKSVGISKSCNLGTLKTFNLKNKKEQSFALFCLFK
ncbi:hypothetical protein CXF95_20175 [Paraglaciecola sp. MB-3u-78]|nr:hypothetical protein CXF95_20175 [Paraglaciecola sp. MB-3u-78]